jgi:hypothetical protein
MDMVWLAELEAWKNYFLTSIYYSGLINQRCADEDYKLNNKFFRLAICSAIVFCCLACAAAKRPILSPNEDLQDMTTEAVQRDIDECLQLAKEAGPGTTRGKQIATQTIGGAAAAAASGAITGGPIGAAAGAVSGVTTSLFQGVFGSSDLDAGKQRYAEDCLRQKGYNPIGWK